MSRLIRLISRLTPAARQAQRRLHRRSSRPTGGTSRFSSGPVGGLTERQARHLDDLIRRYTARTARSQGVDPGHRRDSGRSARGRGLPLQWKEMVYPIVTERSRGSRLWDIDGNEYIDICQRLRPDHASAIAPDFVTEAVAEQLQDGFEIGPQTPLAGEVAELVRELTGMERVTFCNTGSEAVMAAMRVARTVTGRNKIVIFTGDYHGMFDEVLVKGVRKPAARRTRCRSRPAFRAKTSRTSSCSTTATPNRWNTSAARAMSWPRCWSSRCRAGIPALQPVEFLREIREITEAAGDGADFRRSGDRLPRPSRRRAGAFRHPRRPGDLRQGHRRRPADRRPGRQRAVHGRARRRHVAVRRRFVPRGRA